MSNKILTDFSPVLCGLKPVRELIASDPTVIDTVFFRKDINGDLVESAKAARIRFRFAEARELDRLAEGANHQGLVARLLGTRPTDWLDMMSHMTEAPLPLIVMADHIVDPGNLGTLARTLYALGGAGLVVPKDNSAYLGPGARRAAAGALERLAISRVTNLARTLDNAKDAGIAVYGAAYVSETSENLYKAKLRTPAILILGREEDGIRSNIVKRCDALLHIPMARNFDSLNVAQAGAICIAEFSRRYHQEKS